MRERRKVKKSLYMEFTSELSVDGAFRLEVDLIAFD